ncbi:MAG: HAMP domain-containing sensor histidine kinase [bacterium]
MQRYGTAADGLRRLYAVGAFLLLAILVVAAASNWRGAEAFADACVTVMAIAVGLAGLWRGRILESQRRLAWNLLSLGCLAWGLGNAVWTAGVLLGKPPGTVSLADAGYLPLVPLAATALLTMVVGTTNLASRLRIALDALLTSCSVLFVAYAAGLRPLVQHVTEQPTTIGRAVALAYPVGDLFLLALLILVMPRVPAEVRRTLAWLGVALLAVLGSHLGYLVFGAEAASRAVLWSDASRLLGFVIVGYAAIRPIEAAQPLTPTKPGPVGALLPLAPFAICMVVAIQLELRDGILEPFLFWSAIIVVLSLAARQSFMLNENYVLRQQADHALDLLRLQERQRTQMLNNITHDMRHHLSPAVMHLAMIDAWSDPVSERQKRSLGIVRRSTDQVTRLASDLSDAASLEAGRFAVQLAPTDLARVVRDATESLQGMALERSVALDVDAAAEVPVAGDHDRLVQVVFNLVSNAIRFTPAGKRVQVRALRDGGRARVMVRDEGRGLEAQEMARLFSAFTQVHAKAGRKEPGMGLGLFISRGIVEQHQGTIGVTSDGLGLGSTFQFEMPAAPSPERPTTDSAVARLSQKV